LDSTDKKVGMRLFLCTDFDDGISNPNEPCSVKVGITKIGKGVFVELGFEKFQRQGVI
jgi:hypothetical protein